MSWLSELIRNKTATNAPATGTGTVKDIAMSSINAALDKGIQLFRRTPTGSAVETTATRQKVTEIVSNPIFILGALVVGYLIYRGISK